MAFKQNNFAGTKIEKTTNKTFFYKVFFTRIENEIQKILLQQQNV